MKLQRRHFLGALTASVGAAWLHPILNTAYAQALTAPKRFVFVIEGNGVHAGNLLTPDGRTAIAAHARGDITNRMVFSGLTGRHDSMLYGHTERLIIEGDDLSSAPALGPLNAMVNGRPLSQQSAVVLGLSSLITGGGHTSHAGGLTCTRSFKEKPGGESIDALLGRQGIIRRSTPFDVLRVGAGASDKKVSRCISAFGKNKPAPLILDPTVAFDTVFGSVGDPAQQRVFRSRRDLLSFARIDLRRALQGFSGNSRERLKLETYLDSIEKLQSKQNALSDLSETLRAVRPAERPFTGQSWTNIDHFTKLGYQFNLVEAALIGGLTNVAVINSGASTADFNVKYTLADGSEKNRHDLHHELGSNELYGRMATQATENHVSLIADLAATLAVTPEVNGEGTMLDNTIIVYTSDNGEQHHATGAEWPTLIVGGSRMNLRTGGRTVIYPSIRERNNRQLSNLFNILGHCAGINLNDFGGEGAARKSEGPLSDLLAG